MTTQEIEAPAMVGARYALAPELRHGGMSTVQKAFDTHADRLCAIKRLKDAHDEMRWKESFNREYSALSDLSSHPNIVSLYDAGTDERGFYMVLEWMPSNLSEWITKNGALSWSEFYQRFGRPLLEAIVFAQGRGWSHRDIKPSNVLISADGIAKISDYGIAKRLDKPAIGLTFAQFKSVPFSPPEDDAGDLQLTRDCFAWAAVAVFCMTAKMPTDYGALNELAKGLGGAEVPAEILQNALSHSPEERPPLASVLLAELEEYQSARLVSRHQQRVCHVKFDSTCLQAVTRVLNSGSPQEVAESLISELNEIAPGIRRISAHDSQIVIRLFGITWVFECTRPRDPNGYLIISKAWQTSVAEIEQSRNSSYRPSLRFTTQAPVDVITANEQFDELVIELGAFDAEQRDKQALLQRDRLFRIWYAFLRAKADYEERRENAIAYVDAVAKDSTVRLVTELPAPIEIVGQSRIVKLPSGKHLFCDVVDVNLDEVIVHVTWGEVGQLPRRGLLQLNTLAAERAIDRQRAALDAVNFDRCASPNLRRVVVEPSTARPPTRGIRHALGVKDFDQDKIDALEAALGLEDALAIQGPPGTGKTRLIEEIVVQHLQKYPGRRVLISSQTHVALDNVIERVRSREPTLNIVRIGRVDDAKIGSASRDLVLDRKAQQWSEQVSARAVAFMRNWAEDRGIDRANIELGMLAERLILLLIQKRSLEKSLADTTTRVLSLERQTENSLVDTGTADSSEMERAVIEAQESSGTTKNALTALTRLIEDVRRDLQSLGGYGPELAEQDLEQLREWSTFLLGQGTDAAQCRALMELQEDWLLRVGRSSDFHAAMLASAQVVAGTCVGMASVRDMSQVAYDLCIVDEASKATATEILVPLSRSRKWILVGDPAQLPPFFEHASITNLEEFEGEEVRQTLLERFLDQLPPHSVIRLKNQYRMVEPIGDLISTCFYEGLLQSPKKVPDVVLTGAFPKPITWLSTFEKPDRREIRRAASFCNEAECSAVKEALRQINFIANNRKAKYDVALIAGYVAQVKALQDAIRDHVHEWPGLHVTCSTVDSFQGSEAEICIYSVTRSNTDGRLGFLSEKPRLNVALSRGRSALIIVGDDVFCRTAIGENPFRKVLDFIDSRPDQCERRPAL